MLAVASSRRWWRRCTDRRIRGAFRRSTDARRAIDWVGCEGSLPIRIGKGGPRAHEAHHRVPRWRPGRGRHPHRHRAAPARWRAPRTCRCLAPSRDRRARHHQPPPRAGACERSCDTDALRVVPGGGKRGADWDVVRDRKARAVSRLDRCEHIARRAGLGGRRDGDTIRDAAPDSSSHSAVDAHACPDAGLRTRADRTDARSVRS